MTKGRKPKPTRLKLVTGNPGKRAINKNEPKPQPVAPEAAAWLSGDATKVRKLLASKLEALGILTEVDGAAFDLLVSHYAFAAQAAAILASEGILVEDSKGYATKHPAAAILKEQSALFRQFASEFGLTPSARARLSLPEPDEVDEFEEFLNGGGR